MARFGLVSALVPPVRSGQAIILHRLLEKLEPASYVLVANSYFQSKNNSVIATQPLGAPTFLIEPIHLVPAPEHGWRHFPPTYFYLSREIHEREKAIQAIILNNELTTIVACSGDFYSFPAAYLAAKKAGIPFVAYLFDDYMYQCPKYLRPMAWALERMCLRGAAEVIVTNESFRRLIQERHGVKSQVIHNSIDLDALPVVEKAKKPMLDSNHINVVYAGTIYNAHYDAFHHLLSAIDLLNRDDIKLNIFTFQSAEDLKRVGVWGKNLVYHPYLPQSEIQAALEEADLLFLPLAFESPMTPLLRTSAPGKTAEYLALGKPILVHAPSNTFISWYFRENECGFVADSPSVEQLVTALSTALFDGPKRKAVAAKAKLCAHRDFDIRQARDRFKSIIDSVGGEVS